jgi:hypothetical protein
MKALIPIANRFEVKRANQEKKQPKIDHNSPNKSSKKCQIHGYV